MTTRIINAHDRSWEKVVKQYNQPETLRSIWQLCNTIIPYLLVCAAMYYSLQYPYWITLILALVASGFLVRIFIIFHDCGHGAYFKSQKLNKVVGIIAGLFAVTPYTNWHQKHKVHHATAVNLDKRGIGDVWTLTKEEYLNASKNLQTKYKIARYPLILFFIGPIFVVFIQNRFTTRKMNQEEKKNVYLTNILLALLITGISFLIGFKEFLLIQLPVLYFSHVIGIWLFFIQHNFEDIEWERTENWDYLTAALKGSSYLKLSKVFQWFTGNIGYHHIHHLSPRIPNYKLAQVHRENPLFHGVKPIQFLQTFKYINLHLWDEENQKMIPFKDVRTVVLKMPQTSDPSKQNQYPKAGNIR
jgi:acyl-lipid omega-6 desaturase (Delta-12 desaturase)